MNSYYSKCVFQEFEKVYPRGVRALEMIFDFPHDYPERILSEERWNAWYYYKKCAKYAHLKKWWKPGKAWPKDVVKMREEITKLCAPNVQNLHSGS